MCVHVYGESPAQGGAASAYTPWCAHTQLTHSRRSSLTPCVPAPLPAPYRLIGFLFRYFVLFPLRLTLLLTGLMLFFCAFFTTRALLRKVGGRAQKGCQKG